MKRIFALCVLLQILVLPTCVFSQSSFASLSGTVSDETGATISGTKVTATNTNTGVVNTTISNAAGVYNFPSLLPGTYKAIAEQKGFQNQTYKDILLGNAAQIRLNFKLQVAGINESVEVSVAGERALLESSSTSGNILVEKAVQELPSVSNNALDFVKTMSGFVAPVDPINAANAATVGGVSIVNLNVQRDGVPVGDVRYPAGVHSPTQINPEMVGELRMVVSPVDAEMGRGNSQVQILTKSGTNTFHGGVVWDLQNTAIDSNQWYSNNRPNVTPFWRNLNQYTLSVGGPIIKNKSFFYALWNGQISRIRDVANPLALTPCAKKGIFRYFDKWVNGRYGAATSRTGTTPTIPVVDINGNPKRPETNPDGTSYDGQMEAYSVFGKLLKTPMTNDCSDFNPATDVQANTNWDPYRKAMDSTGFVAKFLDMMPVANNYDEKGDGLNYAGSRWTRSQMGNDNMYGIGEDYQRKQINVKIDHNFNEKHRLNGSWSYEKGWSDNNVRVWPKGFGGYADRRPQVLTINFTSMVSATFLNEARFGMSRTGTNMYGVLENPQTGAEARKLVPQVNGMPMAVSLGVGSAAFSVGNASNFWGGRWAGSVTATIRDVSPRTTYSDTLTWMRNRHSFKVGGEIRYNKSYSHCVGACFPTYAFPHARGGDVSGFTVQGINNTNMPGLVGTTSAGSQYAMMNLLSFLSGSVATVEQTYFINSPNKLDTWNDPLTENERIRDYRQKELAFFFKDDWKLHSNLTINLGLRWDYYGVPHLTNGMTIALKGGAAAMYGISGRSFGEAFWHPGDARAALTELLFVGPDTPNPDQSIYPKDKNNFGPAVGFAWQIPWFGKGTTTLRGGYQISYQPANRVSEVEGAIGNPPGSVYSRTYSPTAYTDLSNVASYIPVPQALKPMQPFPLTERAQSISVFDPAYASPYIQNLTMSITRNIGSKFTADMRYIGTLSRKGYTNINVNVPNFRSNGLLDAFNAARYGDDSNPATQLLDRIFQSVRGTKSGASYLRSSTQSASTIGYAFGARYYLANGDYPSLANILSYWPANNVPGGLLRDNGFPENFIKTNPQFNSVTLFNNMGASNYHSVQAQLTMRPVHGVSLQASYTLSKNLGYTGAYTDPLNRKADYAVLASDRTHVFTSYGSLDLPFGPRRLMFNKATGALARIAEGWQISWIANLSSGSPYNITSACMLYGNCVPDLVGNFDYKNAQVAWKKGADRGNYFNGAYTLVPDPQVNMVTNTDSLRNYATTLYAVKDASGNIVLQNPLPGTRGSFGQNKLVGPGTWNVDMTLSKSVKIAESKSLQVRIDIANVFNHPQPSGGYNTSGSRIIYASNPIVTMTSNANYFGDIPYKVGTRTFQGRLRFTF
jgi:hypothetical protein